MEIEYSSKKLKKIFESKKNLTREYNSQIAERLVIMMIDLNSAVSLQDISKMRTYDLHWLKGDRKGEIALTLTKNYRLVVEPINDYIIGDFSSVSIINILRVEDYH
jgi:plasmid maintenance system killer protein